MDPFGITALAALTHLFGLALGRAWGRSSKQRELTEADRAKARFGHLCLMLGHEPEEVRELIETGARLKGSVLNTRPLFAALPMLPALLFDPSSLTPDQTRQVRAMLHEALPPAYASPTAGGDA